VPELIPDEVLMEQVKEGDLSKVSVLYDRYYKHLYNFFVKISLDKELGQDLTQNVFLRMIRFKHTFKNRGKFKAWLFQIARNEFADHFRKLEKNKVKEYEDVASNEDAIDVKWAKNEREKLLYIALYNLSVEQREVLILSKFEKLKYEEIAAIYETSVGAIKAKAHRAMGNLRDHYLKLEKV